MLPKKGQQGFQSEQVVTYSQAKKICREYKITSERFWMKFARKNKKIMKIPVHPPSTYSKQWKGWKSFHGIKIHSTWTINDWVSYETARKFVNNLKLDCKKDFEKWLRLNELPNKHPHSPSSVYKNRGWKSWSYYLGHGKLSSWDITQQLVSYKEAKKYVRKMKITTKQQWVDHIRVGKKPRYIPSRPDASYKKEWKSWGDFMGVRSLYSRFRKFRTYAESKKYAQSLKLVSSKVWFKRGKQKKIPFDIPSNPSGTYKKEWEGWGVFLGNGIIGVIDAHKYYFPLSKIREIINQNNIKNYSQYDKFRRAHPEFKGKLPTTPLRQYGFTEWKEFFGFEPQRGKEFMTFEEAKEWARKSGITSSIQWQKAELPLKMPRHPRQTYSEERITKFTL